MAQHAGHRLEPLEASGEKLFPGGSCVDPMGVGYIEVTNGQDRYVVRRARKSIQEPMSYELIHGQLSNNGLAIEIQESEIKKEIKNHFSWAPATCPDDGKISLFIELVREVVEKIDPHRIQISEYASTDDAIAYGAFDRIALESLMERCAVYFLPDEVAALRRFVETHSSGCDVMALVLRSRLIVEPNASQ
ncbi:MAG TPA: hypothetical protein VIE89_32685 [Candidatus Binatia bacterium]